MTSAKKPSLRLQIYQLIKEKRGQKVHIGDIQRFADSQGYLPSNGDRRARDLVDEFVTIKGVKKPNPFYCPEIKRAIENKCAVYWYEEPLKVNPVSNYRCTQCSKDAVTYKDSKPVCQAHSVRQVSQAGLFMC